MTAKELKEHILSLVQDIEFEYNGKHGAICPFDAHNICIGFDGDEIDCHNIDEVMTSKVFDGQSLSEICEHAIFDC